MDPIGIRSVQGILMNATQKRLSHFHTAGMDTNAETSLRPSAADAMDSLYTRHNTSMRYKGGKQTNLVGKKLADFIVNIGSSITELPERENIWYEVLGEEMQGNVLRIYVDFAKLREHRVTLREIAKKCFGDDHDWKVSPDFMGMIDINIGNSIALVAPCLSTVDTLVCGTPDILSCKEEGDYTVTQGTDILTACRVPGVDKSSIVSNNVKEVQRLYGIEAAASVLEDLLESNIVSDFMTRTGNVLPFGKTIEVCRKGITTSMGFERPKSDIKSYITGKINYGNYTSLYERMMMGLDPRVQFSLRND